MRLTLRAAGLLAIAVAAITCTDAPTGPRTHGAVTPARLGIAPSFSPTASRAYAALASIGIAVTQVHVTLTAADGRRALDTTIQFPALQDTLTVQLALSIHGSAETFTALFELMDASGTTLFAQTQSLTVFAASLPAVPAPVITLQYVGPGHNARTVTVSPTDVTIPAGSAQTLTASGTDSSGGALTNLLLGWRSSDTTLAVVTGTGPVAVVQSTGRRGTVTITATLPTGVAGSAHLILQPLATTLQVVGGNAQVDSVGRTLAQPLVVRATDAFNLPVAGATVSWTRIAGVGAVAAATTTTDTAGLARVGYTLGTTLGTDSVRAALGGATTGAATGLFTARSISLSAKAIAALSGGGQSATVLTALANMLVARVTDSLGNPVTGASVLWGAPVTGSVTFAPITSATGTDGLARTTATFGPTAGVIRMTANLGAVSAVYDGTALAGPPARVGFVSPWPGTAATAAGAAIAPQPVLQLYDVSGNPTPVANVSVTAAVASGPVGSVLGGATAVTDATGKAVFSGLSVGGTVGTYTLQFAAGTYTPVASGSVSIVAGVATKIGIVQPPPASMFAGLVKPAPSVRVTDAYGNGVAGVPVTVAATGLLATLTGTLTATTDQTGLATFSNLTLTGTLVSTTLVFTTASPALSVTSQVISLL
jgi:hypothetical protein